MDELFDKIWDRMAEEGKCDTRDGAEYRRVKAEWEEDRDLLIERYIIEVLQPYGGRQ